MRGLHDYIIHVDNAFNDTFNTGNVELYLDRRLSRDRAANRVGKVVESPALHHDNPLANGTEVMFDATVLYQQIFNGVTQESRFLADSEKSLYKLRPSMIVLYKKVDSWHGFEDNLMVKKLEKEKPKTSLLLSERVQEDSTRAEVKFGNKELDSLGVFEGMTVCVREGFGVPFYIGGETYHWVRTKDILGLWE